LKPIRNPYNAKQNTESVSINDTVNSNTITVKKLLSRKIYISPFLEEVQLPSENSIELEPELELLRKLISSIIVKMKDSYTLLKEH